jgi:hypothetical protein
MLVFLELNRIELEIMISIYILWLAIANEVRTKLLNLSGDIFIPELRF